MGSTRQVESQIHIGGFAGGEISLVDDGVTFIPCAMMPDEVLCFPDLCHPSPPVGDGIVPFLLPVAGKTLHGELTSQVVGDHSLMVRYEIEADDSTETGALAIDVRLPDGIRGEKTAPFSEEAGRAIPGRRIPNDMIALEPTLVLNSSSRAFTLTIRRIDHGPLRLDAGTERRPTDRIRLPFIGEDPGRAGRRSASFLLQTPGRIVWSPYEGPVTISPSEKWIPLSGPRTILPGSPLDFSSQGMLDAPAGKYGRLVARGEDFEFEGRPGYPCRFYGVNTCAGANFLTLEEARAFADRLARIGYNSLRIHHHDGFLVRRGKSPMEMDEEALQTLDNLVFACEERGIYLSTDLFVSRGVRYRDVGIDRDGFIDMQDYKMLLPVCEGAFENLRRFTCGFLNHVNRHTGVRYADDPALAWLSLVNEGNLGNMGGMAFREKPQWRAAWAEWLDEKKGIAPETYRGISAEVPPGDLAFRTRDNVAFTRFLTEMEMRFFERFSSFVREELGCRALLTDFNGWFPPSCYQEPRQKLYDYVDNHFYIDHPSFLGKPWELPSRCPNENPFRNEWAGVQSVVLSRIYGKPFTISEYNYSAPGRYRGVGGIATGTMAALQNWAGTWRFAWSHCHDGCSAPDEARLGYFDVSGDPLALAAERASIALFLRRDLPPLPTAYLFRIPPRSDEALGRDPLNMGDLCRMAWYRRFGTSMQEEVSGDYGYIGSSEEDYGKPTERLERECLAAEGLDHLEGPVEVDRVRGAFTITTDRTAGGFAEEGRVEAGPLVAILRDAPATIWATSLDKKALRDSDQILLTHLTDVQNSSIRYADEKLQVLLDWGRLPHLMRNGQASILLKLHHPEQMEVRLLSTDGTVREVIPSEIREGCLCFNADIGRVPSEASFLYEIVRKGSACAG